MGRMGIVATAKNPEVEKVKNQEGMMASEKSVRQIKNNFSYHPPKGDQQVRYETIRTAARELATTIDCLVPDSREKSLAMTNLEQAVMWANAAIARNE